MPTLASLSTVAVSLDCSPALAERELHVIRAQAALVRTLLDELEQVAPPRDSVRFAASLATQAAEELADLACKMMSVASSIAPESVEALHRQSWPGPSAPTGY